MLIIQCGEHPLPCLNTYSKSSEYCRRLKEILKCFFALIFTLALLETVITVQHCVKLPLQSHGGQRCPAHSCCEERSSFLFQGGFAHAFIFSCLFVCSFVFNCILFNCSWVPTKSTVAKAAIRLILLSCRKCGIYSQELICAPLKSNIWKAVIMHLGNFCPLNVYI